MTAKTPDALARELGFSGVEAQEWQVQHALLKRLRKIVVDMAWRKGAALPEPE
jgi:hypothetical protein